MAPDEKIKKKKRKKSSSSDDKKVKRKEKKAKKSEDPQGPEREEEELVIRVVQEDDRPILAAFPGGLPESLTKSSHEPLHESPRFTVHEKGDKKFLKGTDEVCVYQSGLKNNDSRLQTCLAVKQGHTVYLYPAETYSLRQSVPQYQSSQQASNASSLFADFGSAKKQKVLKSRAANRMVDNVLGDSKSFWTQQETPTASAATEATDAWRHSFLPQGYNVEATQSEDVYPPAKFVGREAWDDAGEQVPGTKYGCLNGLSGKAVTILHYWLEMYLSYSSRKPSFCNHVPSSIRHSFLEQFTSRLDNRNLMSKAHKDRCSLHLGLLLMHSTNMQTTRLADLARDMGMDSKPLGQLLRQAGCSVKTKKVTLPVPVVFPSALKRRRATNGR